MHDMDKEQICKGLRELQDWIKYNTESAWQNEHRLLSDHDHEYYQKILRGAEDKLTSDPATGSRPHHRGRGSCDYGIGG